MAELMAYEPDHEDGWNKRELLEAKYEEEWRATQATIDRAIRWLRLPLAALGLLLAPLAPTFAAASPASVETRTKAEREGIERLREQIKQLTRQSPLSVENALAILGAQKGQAVRRPRWMGPR